MEVDSKVFLNVYVEKLTQKCTNLANQIMLQEVQLHFATEQLKKYAELEQNYLLLLEENKKLKEQQQPQTKKEKEKEKTTDY